MYRTDVVPVPTYMLIGMLPLDMSHSTVSLSPMLPSGTSRSPRARAAQDTFTIQIIFHHGMPATAAKVSLRWFQQLLSKSFWRDSDHYHGLAEAGTKPMATQIRLVYA
ncbi:hypothetical protein HAX54_025313 [Datura stramonium]|uniref:Uncharacterized protein n=1 Tax=Datura stramonium TaxID=4076 RepID=A0ABS8UZY8_DATST|nr:hypothetical protein [Datura stramonium]